MTDPLPMLPDGDFRRVLCIVAHPDDLEYGTSAAVAHWTRRGVEVAYVLLTAGEAGMDDDPARVAALREREQRAACETVGVADLQILGHPDGMVQPTLDLRRDIARAVRRFRPDAVVTANWEVEAYGGLNQADHRVAGLAVADGVRDADNAWVFRELVTDEGLEKWHTRVLLVGGHPESTHAVEVDRAAVDAGVRSLECHAAYLAHVTGHPAPAEFIPQILRSEGEAAGVEYAVAFRVFDLGGLGGSEEA